MLTLILLPLLSAAPIEPVDESVVVPVDGEVIEPTVIEEELGERAPLYQPGSRFGFLGLAAFDLTLGLQSPYRPLPGDSRTVSLNDAGGTFAIGLRYGLMDRTYMQQWMPALGFVVGTSVSQRSVSPFTEVRAEFLTVSGDGALQPNFVVYGASGLTLTGSYGPSFALSPHVGFGIGWNWLPSGGLGGGSWGNFGGSGQGALVAIPAAIAIGLMIFAGRLEVRYVARPFLGAGNDYLAVMIGAGT